MELPRRNTQRWALGLDYRGTAFCGWQRQLGQPSVQQALEEALSKIAATWINVTAAGRTDTGVHASLQIVHFETEAQRSAMAWQRGGNQFLPDDISVRWVVPVDAEFHARFAARSRHYVYLLTSQPQRHGLNAGRIGWTHWPLDLARMQAALLDLCGTHDFTSFRAAECQAKSPIKTMYSATAQQRGSVIRLDFQADAYLHHMIRNIVGTLVYIGSGRQPVDWLKALIASKDRKLAAPTFSPDGLYLAGIEYDPRFALPETFVDPCL